MSDTLDTPATAKAAEPAARFSTTTPLGLIASLVTAVAVFQFCSWTGVSAEVQNLITPTAGALPAAIELYALSRRRDKTADAELVRTGDLRRPAGLVLILLVAAILVADSLVGALNGLFTGLVSEGVVDERLAGIIAPTVLALPLAVFGVCLFLGSSYCSHYFGAHPYRLTIVAVACALAARLVIVTVSWNALDDVLTGQLIDMVFATALVHVVILAICLAGAWFGRSHHGEFLARKLARIEGSG